MERLTDRFSDGTAFVPNHVIQTKGMQSVIEKLAEYEDKQEQGLLIELPCKIGSTVYWFNKYRKEIKPLKVLNITIDSCGIKEVGFCTASYTPAFATKEKFGIELFFARSEAEEALAKMEGKA